MMLVFYVLQLSALCSANLLWLACTKILK